MTNEEALRILHCPSAYLTDEDSELAHTIPMFSKAYGQALAVAFKSLEAWEKVKAEIEQTAKDYDKFDDYRRVRGLWIALKIIDKHLKEVSE